MPKIPTEQSIAHEESKRVLPIENILKAIAEN